jgi:outer membrane protein assembly factor BamB
MPGPGNGFGGPGTAVGPNGLTFPPQPGAARGTSRRGLLIGAGVGGIAVIGGALGWALNARSPGAATPSGFGSTSLPTGLGLPTGSGVPTGSFSQYYGAGPRRSAAWKVATGNAIEANPGAGGGKVFVVSTDNNLYAIDIASKAKAWTFESGGATAAPEVIGDVVCMSTSQGHFYALRAADGKAAWDVDTNVAATYKRSWASNGGNVILSTATTAPRAYDAATGKPGVTYPTQEPYALAIGAGDGGVYAIDAFGTLYGFNTDGTEIWHNKLFSTNDLPSTGLTVAGGSVYVGTISGALYKVSGASGKVQWTYHPGNSITSNVVVDGGLVYLRDNSGNMRAVSAADKKQVWSRAASGAGLYGATVSGGRVYYTTSLSLQALDAKSGNPVWAFSAPSNSALLAAPVVANGFVFVGGFDDTLYAVQV